MAVDHPQQRNYGESLYHPHIHIKNVDWLKSALLYWDRVRRIVPDGFPPDAEDPDLDPEVLEVIEIRSDLLPRTPPTAYTDAAREKFMNCADVFRKSQGPGQDGAPGGLLGLLEHAYQRISGSNEIDRRSLKQLLESLLKDSRGSAEVDMWNNKMHQSLLEAFRSEGLLRVDDNSGWVMVQKAAADLYMICLATVMSEKISAPLITYNPGYADVGKYLDFGNPESITTDRISMLLELEVPFPSPEELHDIPLTRILEIHDETEEERRSFRRAAEDLLSEASEAKGDEYRYEGFLKEKKATLEGEFRRHKEKMGSLQVRGFGSLLRIGAPTAVTSLMGAAGALGYHIDLFAAGALAGTGAILSGMAWWGEVRQQRRDTIENFPYHYLLRLKEELP